MERTIEQLNAELRELKIQLRTLEERNKTLIPIPPKKRKCVVATYTTESIFKIPKEIDLEGDEVKDWWVKYDTLHISFKDGRENLLIEPTYAAADSEYKRPDKEELKNHGDYCWDLDEEDKEE